jgi:MscS family membrane protein
MTRKIIFVLILIIFSNISYASNNDNDIWNIIKKIELLNLEISSVINEEKKNSSSSFDSTSFVSLESMLPSSAKFSNSSLLTNLLYKKRDLLNHMLIDLRKDNLTSSINESDIEKEILSIENKLSKESNLNDSYYDLVIKIKKLKIKLLILNYYDEIQDSFYINDSDNKIAILLDELHYKADNIINNDIDLIFKIKETENNSLVLNYQKLKSKFIAIEDVINYLKSGDVNLFEDEVNYVIDYIDNIRDTAKKNNIYFEYKKIDSIEFIFSIILISIVFIFRKVFANLAALLIKFLLISEESSSMKGVWRRLVVSLQNPIQLFLMAIVIHFSVYLIYYPAEMPSFIERFFSITHYLTAIWILWNLLDNFDDILAYATKGEKPRIRREVLHLISSIVEILLIVVSIFVVIYISLPEVFGLILQLSAILGVGIALIARDIVGNFFSSVYIIFSPFFNQDDWIVLEDGQDGDILEIGLRNTIIWTFDNGKISIPNSKLAGMTVKNYSNRTLGRRIKFNLSIPMNTKTGAVQAIIQDINNYLQKNKAIAKAEDVDNKTKGVFTNSGLKGKKTTLFVHLTEIKKYSYEINIYAFTKTVDWGKWRNISQEIILRCADIVRDNDVELISNERGHLDNFHTYIKEKRIQKEEESKDTYTFKNGKISID